VKNAKTSQTDVRVITTADRHRGVVAWLLLAAPDKNRARAEWENDGAAVLQCGLLFTAVRIPGTIVRAVAGTRDPTEVDAFLVKNLDGGGVFTDAGLNRYYALVPGGAVYDWKVPGTECLPRGICLGVPAVESARYEPGVQYWASPMDSPGDLCDERKVADLVLAGWGRLVQQEPSDRGEQS
jgi:hypothetical protein